MVATLRAAQIKDDLTTLDVTLINSNCQFLWHYIVLEQEMQSSHPEMLQSPSFFEEMKDVN